MNVMTFGERLTAALLHARKSRKELCAAIGITPQAVSQAIAGRASGDRGFNAANNARAADYLGVDPTWLASGEGVMIPGTAPPHPTGAVLSAQGRELGLLFDLVQGQVERAVVYNKLTAIILQQLAAATQPSADQVRAD